MYYKKRNKFVDNPKENTEQFGILFSPHGLGSKLWPNYELTQYASKWRLDV